MNSKLTESTKVSWQDSIVTVRNRWPKDKMDQLDLVVVQLMIDEARKDKLQEVANAFHAYVATSETWKMLSHNRNQDGTMTRQAWLWLRRCGRRYAYWLGNMHGFKLKRQRTLYKLAHSDLRAFCYEVIKQCMQYRLEKLGVT